MKKIISTLSLLAAITFLMISCNGGGNDPKAVAKNFFEALKTMNVEEAQKYATKDSKTVLSMMQSFSAMASTAAQDSLKKSMAKQNIKYSEPVINGDEATITVTVDEKEKTDFKLKKEDGLWKVAFDKNTLMKTGMEKMQEHGASGEDIQKAQEAIDQLHSDTVQNALKSAREQLDSINK